MRLGVGLNFHTDDPEAIAHGYRAAGYTAAICPPVSLDQPERLRSIREAFARQDVRIAEVGVWNNMLDPDPQRRKANLEANNQALAVADEVGAVCCVNIAGSFNPNRWDGPHPKNLSRESFEATVENVRQILKAVKPRRTVYCLEGMPWAVPDGPQCYLELLQAVGDPGFGVHLDPVNWINSPARYFENASLLRECFQKLGRWIVSIHAKDILLGDRLTVHLEEKRPGLGKLDYVVFLQEADRLPLDTPVILEHLPEEEYPSARAYLLRKAEEAGAYFYPNHNA
jgi:sugar phosphate isomerase/epimerase